MDPEFWTPDRVRAVLVCAGLLAVILPFLGYIFYRLAQEDKCEECGYWFTRIIDKATHLVRMCPRCGHTVSLDFDLCPKQARKVNRGS
jgi:hypothetical protein